MEAAHMLTVLICNQMMHNTAEYRHNTARKQSKYLGNILLKMITIQLRFSEDADWLKAVFRQVSRQINFI